MAGVEIGTLRLRGPPSLAPMAAFRVEDAFRTELAETGRLILIRRMRPGLRAASSRPEDRAAAVRQAYAAATRDARHGRDAGDAAFLNCVWFESPCEARRLLLAELLAGRRPTGWYWRLAVPEWRGRPLEAWLVDIVAEVLGGGARSESLALLVLVLDRADLGIVLKAVEVAAEALFPRSASAMRPPDRVAPGAVAAIPPGPTECLEHPRATVAELRGRLPAALRDGVETLARRLGYSAPPALRLLERLALQASPTLALDPVPLRALARAWSEQLEAATPSPLRPAPGRPSLSGPPRLRADELAPAPTPGIHPASPAGSAAPAERPPVPVEPQTAASTEQKRADAPFFAAAGPASDFAGLWLAVPSLIRLGFREWLCGRPDLLGQDPGRTLLRTLARHHRVPDRDPALAPFEALGELGETPQWALCWRRGLDGWLRRRAHMPLHRLIRRWGEVSPADEAVTVRFPPDAADLRLRRRALDVDPGWVDWLGLSVRYRYEERGL